MDLDLLIAELVAGKTAALARAISVVENGRPGFERFLAEVHRSPRPGSPHRHHRSARSRQIHAGRAPGPRLPRGRSPVGVVAVDPTSPFTGGALLGDRIRMESVALDEGVYIRSMATRGSLGGLATSTREVCDLLDAAGFDRILVETVGVGQSELDVARMADSTVLVLVPESGDGIQTLKSGVMEIADIFVVNKADRPGADKLRREIEITLGIRRGNAFRNMPAHHGAARRVRGTDGRRRTHGAASDRLGPSGGAHCWQPRVRASTSSSRRSTATTSGSRAAARSRSGAAGGCWNGPARWWSAPRAVGSGEETRAEQMISERLDQVVDGTLSPYDVATEVLDSLKQGARL